MRKEYDQRHFNRLQSKSRIFGLPDLIPNLQLAHGFLKVGACLASPSKASREED